MAELCVFYLFDQIRRGNALAVHLRNTSGGLVLLDDPLPAQHGRVGDGPGDVLPVQPLIELDGGVKVVNQVVGLLLEPACPEFHSIAPS